MRTSYKKAILIFLGVLIFLSASDKAFCYVTGRVVDFFSGRPIKGAIVNLNGATTLTNENGLFILKSTGKTISVRANGYLRAEQAVIIPLITATMRIKLTPFTPKALYLSFYGIGTKVLRLPALKLLDETELNALVIDVKGDRGLIVYKSSVPLAAQAGAQKLVLIKDMAGMIKSLKDKGIYTIARIVVFKDNALAVKFPGLAVKKNGKIWRDKENLAWVDPFRKETWDYNIDIAIEAARLGFDEIQFDYIRFPDTPGLQFSKLSTEDNRVDAITGFLSEAKKRLAPYNVFISADIFGYVCWNLNDTDIGQKIERLAPLLDYISPMLYPTGFQYGIPGYRIPVEHPYEIVYLSLKHAQARTHLLPNRFRPWLQAFRDYAFDRRPFTGKEIREQINAAEEFGADGWMLWNPRNDYSKEGLKK